MPQTPPRGMPNRQRAEDAGAEIGELNEPGYGDRRYDAKDWKATSGRSPRT